MTEDRRLAPARFRWIHPKFQGILGCRPVSPRAEAPSKMPLPEENELPELNPAFGDDSEQKQRRQMLIALALLLLALILVLIKDREFWFPPEPAAASRGGTRRADSIGYSGATGSGQNHGETFFTRPSQRKVAYCAAAGGHRKPGSCSGSCRYQPCRASSAGSRGCGRRRTPNRPAGNELRQSGITAQNTHHAHAVNFRFGWSRRCHGPSSSVSGHG